MSRFSRLFFLGSTLFGFVVAVFLLQSPPPVLINQAAGRAEQLPKIVILPHVAASPEPTEPPAPTANTITETAPQPPAAPATVTKKPSSAPAPQPKPATPTCGGAFTQQFLCLLNQYRASKGLRSLSYSSSLASVALGHSQWMNKTGTFSHTGVNGSRLADRCHAAGITCRGENLAKDARSAQHLLDLWRASASHNANLLGNYATMGLGASGSYITLLLN